MYSLNVPNTFISSQIGNWYRIFYQECPVWHVIHGLPLFFFACLHALFTCYLVVVVQHETARALDNKWSCRSISDRDRFSTWQHISDDVASSFYCVCWALPCCYWLPCWWLLYSDNCQKKLKKATCSSANLLLKMAILLLLFLIIYLNLAKLLTHTGHLVPCRVHFFRVLQSRVSGFLGFLPDRVFSILSGFG
jgi:hypothetical protein